MSTGEKKPTTLATAPPTGPVPQEQASKLPQPVKNPLVSRRTFLKGALGASVVLAGVSMVTSGQILSPLLPEKEEATAIASVDELEDNYHKVLNTDDVFKPAKYSSIFYWPYKESVSPYYKNVVVRIPSDQIDLRSETDKSVILPHFAAFNTTCVHLRCLVNPGFGDNEYRLQCPCHGSQYRLTDGVPVKGPAYDLGLLPLPRIVLDYDPQTRQLIAKDMIGVPGIGRQ